MVQIIVGSMLGASEYVAEAIAEVLTKQGITSELHLQPDLQEITCSGNWIVITSTHGAGDLPDNIQTFAEQLKSAQLSDVSFLVIALGDSSYDTFCEGGKSIHRLLEKAGARAKTPPHCIDVLTHTIPEENAVEWFSSIYQDALGV